MRLVIDASVALKWLFQDRPGEQFASEAHAILPAVYGERATLFQPPHWITEVLAVVVREAPSLVPMTLNKLSSLDARVASDEATYIRACDLSQRHKQHLFDALYHAVALERGALLVTADERYNSAARGKGSIVRIQELRLT